MKAYRYRLYPDREQEAILLWWLEFCRRLYNCALSDRREQYRATGHGLTYGVQSERLPIYKKQHAECIGIHSQVLQNVLIRLDRAFTSFFEGRTRYPRFKRYGEYLSLTYPQIGPENVGKNSVVLPKLGRVRLVKHRPLKGEPKTLTVIGQPCGRWYAVIAAELAPVVKPETSAVHTPVGVDSGLTNYLYLSDGTHVDNPRFLDKHEKRIKNAQKSLNCKIRIPTGRAKADGNPETRWSKNGLKAKTILARRWREYTDEKDDWQWKQANPLVKTHDFVAYEDLPILNMVKNHSLARAIQDASWGGFWGKVENLAAQADSTRIQKVNPKWTTMRCSRCKHLNLIALSERTFRCTACGYTAPRDGNAAQNIKEFGLEASGLRHEPVGMDDPEYTPAETWASAPEAERLVTVKSPVKEAGSKGSTRADRARDGRQARGEAHGFSRGRMSPLRRYNQPV